MMLFTVFVAVFALTASVYEVQVTHVYTTRAFTLDLIILVIIGLEITSYRTRLYKWRRAKAWEDQLRKDSE